MQGAILYPTDEDIEALNQAILCNQYREMARGEDYTPFKELPYEDMITILFGYYLVISMFRYFTGQKPLKINETVLG